MFTLLQHRFAKSNELCSILVISLLKRPFNVCKFTIFMQTSSSNHLPQTKSSAKLTHSSPNGKDPNQRNIVLLSLGFALAFFGMLLFLS